MATSDPLRQIFANLDRWRHLPSYQLERRFDVFLTPYLRDLVQAKLGVELADVIVPEMPLKQPEGNHTDKADYVMFAKGGDAAYLIELKTDCNSLRDKQDDYLLRAAARPWRQTLEELKEVVAASQKRRKYVHLLSLLKSAGQVEFEPDLLECFRKGAAARFRPDWVRVTTRAASVELLYLTPICVAGRKCLTFEEVAAHLARQGDPLAPLMAEYLNKWTCEAGSESPETPTS